MDCYWYRRLGGFIYQGASSRLFIPRGNNVFPLCITEMSFSSLSHCITIAVDLLTFYIP